MTILVCGGAGYVGSHTVAELLDQGVNVIVVDNLETGHKDAVFSPAKLYIGDLQDYYFMNNVFCENKIDAVIHFAAYSLVGESVAEPLKYYENNVYGTMCLLKTMKEQNVNKIVFSSTAAIFGEPESIPINENDRKFPGSPYGETKLSVEKMLQWFDYAYGIKYVVLRYFNAAGAHQSGKIGEDHNPESHLIPIILKTALGKQSELSIFGVDYPTKDGTCIRDYIHVTDLAKAHILSVEKLICNNDSAIYNLGSGKGFTVFEVIEAARQITGSELPIKFTDKRPGDPVILIASSEKIKKELGWKIRYESLEEIIASAWKWHKNNPNGFIG